MKSIFVLTRPLQIVVKMKWYDKKLVVEAFLLMAFVRLVILLVPFKRYKKYLGAYNDETPHEIDLHQINCIKKVSWVVSLVARHTPWESKCLVQAVTAQIMLKKRNVSSTLYLGVNKDKNYNMNAHAWLRSGQVIVTGGHNRKDFKEVAKFALNK
jgi:hypothetical protein